MGLINEFIFKLPEEFVPKIINGEYQRFGALIKDTDSGRIIGHLKETGNLGLLNNFVPAPINLISKGVDIAIRNYQHNQVMKALNALQFTGYVNAGLGVANLIATIISTKMILSQIRQTEEKLSLKLDEIIHKIDKVHFDRIKDHISQLEASFETMQVISKHGRSKDITQRIVNANHNFLTLKKQFLKDFNDFEFNNKLQIPSQPEMLIYNMFNFACIGSYSTEFLIGDYDSIEKTLVNILEDRQALNLPNYEAVYTNWWESKVKNLSTDGIREINSGDYAVEIKQVKDTIDDDQQGFEFLVDEISFMETNRIDPQSYYYELREMEPNIVLICPKNGH